MLTLEPLHTLVHSLNKSEKRYYRISCGTPKIQKDYLHLFDVLDSHTSFNGSLMEKIRETFPGSRIEPVRKHLYHTLMRALRQFESNKDVENQIESLLHDSRILYKKGLIRACFYQLEKAKTLAIEHEKFLHYIMAARQELNYQMQQQFLHLNESDLVESHHQIETILQKQFIVMEQAKLSEILLFRYLHEGIARSPQSVIELNDLMLEEHHLLTRNQLDSFESQHLHLQFQSNYFLMTGNPEGSLSVFRELEVLFQQHQLLWKSNPVYYLQLIDGILKSLRSMKRFDELQFYYERLESLRGLSNNLMFIVKYTLLSHRLHGFADQLLFEEGIILVRNLSLEVEHDLHKLPLLMRAELQSALARLYFQKGEYSYVLRIVNVQLNQLSVAISSQHPLYIIFELLHLQANILLNNADYLFYAARTLERKLRADRKLYGVEKLLLKYTKRWIKNKACNTINEDLTTLHNNPFERQILNFLAIPLWVSKINSRYAKKN